jgi:hypothetical protein
LRTDHRILDFEDPPNPAASDNGKAYELNLLAVVRSNFLAVVRSNFFAVVRSNFFAVVKSNFFAVVKSYFLAATSFEAAAAFWAPAGFALWALGAEGLELFEIRDFLLIAICVSPGKNF